MYCKKGGSSKIMEGNAGLRVLFNSVAPAYTDIQPTALWEQSVIKDIKHNP